MQPPPITSIKDRRKTARRVVLSTFIGLVVYSVGEDLKDDGGRERPTPRKSSDKSSYDLTFKVLR